VEEMELSDIYNLTNHANGTLKISKEKLFTIENELSQFRKKAKQQILRLQQKEILPFYETNRVSDNDAIASVQSEAIAYLNAYKH
jgi:hypothetical protein